MSASEFSPAPFGRYYLRSLLAEGGMAEIFIAEHVGAEDVSKILAVKRMLPHLCRQPALVTMFLDEARIASRFSHPNIVSIFDFGEVGGRYYLAMEFLVGDTLTTVIKKAYGSDRPMPVPIVLAVMAAVCDGLHYAHSFADNGVALNVVHRDISPSNIMLTYQGGVKVVDFGVARALDRRQEATETGVVKGKWPYCSPEQLQAGEVDRRSDIFSLGVVFFEALTGRRLFKRDTDLLTCMAVLNAPIPKVSELRGSLSPDLDRVVAKALERNVDRRYQTCQEMRRDLERLMEGAPPRIDEYLADLLGEEHIQNRSTMGLPASQSRPTIVLPKNGFPARSAGSGGKSKSLASLPVLEPPGPPATAAKATPAIPEQAGDPGLTRSEGRALRERALPKWPIAIAAFVATAATLLAADSLMSRNANSGPQPVAPTALGPTHPPVTATLDIDTLPRGAAIEVGGARAPGVSPVRVESLVPGDVVVRATLEGFQPLSEVVKLEPGASKSVVLKLLSAQARLEVKAPEKARLLVDGIDYGAGRGLPLPPGEHKVAVQLAGFTPFEQKVTLSVGEAKVVEAQLVPAKKVAPGKLDVQCTPWCQVLLDGADVGRPSPISGLTVSAGQHRLTLVHPPSGHSKEVVLKVAPGQTVRESASFR